MYVLAWSLVRCEVEVRPLPSAWNVDRLEFPGPLLALEVVEHRAGSISLQPVPTLHDRPVPTRALDGDTQAGLVLGGKEDLCA